jgi:Hypervirulence associated proteins TUDOR domain
MSNKSGITVGDMVGWNSSGGHAMGKVVKIKRDGVINVPDSKFTVEGTADDPAVLIRIYRNGEATETLVGHKMSTLSGTVAKYNSNHDTIGRFAGGSGDEATGIAPNGDNNMSAMDMMDIKHPPRSKRKLTASEQKLLNRITSPATNYVLRPGENRGVYNTPFSSGPTLNGGVTGYVPNSGVTEQPGAGGM